MPEPYVFSAPLTVAVDVRDAQSYLALAPTFAVADELQIEVDWLPVVAPQVRPPPAQGEDRGSRHRRARAAYRERDLERYADAQGLTIRSIYRAPDSSLAGMGLLAAKAHSARALRSYLDAVFAGYWNETLDIEDAAALAKLLDQCGAGRFEPDPMAFGELNAGLKAAGVFAAPMYVVEDELFHGRAHLPMIRWILEGREGPGPI